MVSSSLLDFGWVILFSALAGIISVRLKIPPVVILLLCGLAIGPNLLHLVDLPTINVFADIGAALLLFTIGIEFSVAKLLSTGLRAVISSMLLVFVTFTLMHVISVLIGLDPVTALYVSAVFSMSSTAIMMKIFEQKKLLDHQEVPALFTILIIEDIIAVFLLTFFSNLKTIAYTSDAIVSSILLSLGVLAFTYVILLKILNRFSSIFLANAAEDTLVFFAFTLGMGMAVLSSLLGLSPAIGAFLAGSMISALPRGRDMERSMRPFSLIFSSFFFLSIGMLINPSALIATAPLTFVLLGAFMLTVFVSTYLVFFLMSASPRSAIFAGIAMLPLGEFSLLIAKESIGIVAINLVGIASLGVLITSTLCSILLDQNEKAYALAKKYVPPKVSGTLTDASGYFRNVLGAFEPQGSVHKLFLTELNRSKSDLLYLIFLSILVWIVYPYLGFTVVFNGMAFYVSAIVLAAFFIFSIIPALRLLYSIKAVLDALATVFSSTTPRASKPIILRNFVIGAVFFLLFANSYLLTDVLLLPKEFNWFSIPFGMLSVFFFWSAFRATSFWFFISESRGVNILRNRILSTQSSGGYQSQKKKKPAGRF